MAVEKRIPGRDGVTTIVGDSFALFGTKVVGPPERADKTEAEREAERKADRIKYSEVLKAFAWSDEDFSRAKGFRFPDFVGRTTTSGWGVSEPFYSRRQVNEWREQLLAFCETVK
jgi:hypothetical protein